MQILFPNDPLDPRRVEEYYADEFASVQKAGVSCALFSFEDFEQGSFRARPALLPEQIVVYRGWMLKPADYRRLAAAVEAQGASMLTSPQHYQACHHLPEWYPHCVEWTAETVVLPSDADLESALTGLDWPGFFIKDYVKSLTTQRGSIANTPQEVVEIVELLKRFQGEIEGGICVRKREYFQAESEERFFVINGKAYGRTGEPPELVEQIAAKISSPFFSVDLARNMQGQWRLIEIGDGQVSDKKDWRADDFRAILEVAIS
jgi:hypothetical protein